MPAVLEPPELARLVDLAERPRVDDWSLRAALVRYAQPEPARVGAILESVRRIEFALHPQQKLLEKEGPSIWPAVADPTLEPAEEHRAVVGLLREAAKLDGLGDQLAAWAVHRAGERPDAEVDAVTAEVAARLDELGIAREQRERPPPGARRRG